MLESGKTYKHDNCIDVAIYISTPSRERAESVDFIVQWVNVSSSKPFFICQDHVTIKRSDFSRWKELKI